MKPAQHTSLSIHSDAIRPQLPDGDLWVFAYGSLMWNPGFRYQQKQTAHLYGYHRALCVWSHVHRGTPEHPGMVLGLDRGGSCRGSAFLVSEQDKLQVTEYLYAREMPTPVYRAQLHPVRLMEGNRQTMALTFIVDPDHAQYAGKVEIERAADQIRNAHGISGSSREYLSNTLEHLEQLDIRDRHLQQIRACLDGLSPEQE